MDYTITIADELIPGIVALAHTEGRQPEEIVQEYATTAANKACQDYQVGPYWVMPTPRFNPDGTPYDPNWVDPNQPVVDNDLGALLAPSDPVSDGGDV